jgi:hypothetical protein
MRPWYVVATIAAPNAMVYCFIQACSSRNPSTLD